ncbi:sigma 54-interacting transcriptional regulator [Thermodesulfobacteriota bacterium]
MEAAAKKVCILDEQEHMIQKYRSIFRRSGYSLTFAKDITGGLELVKESQPDIIILNLSLPPIDSTEDAIVTIKRFKKAGPTSRILITSDKPDPGAALRMLHNGAEEFISGPLDGNRFRILTDRAIERREMEVQAVRLDKGLRRRRPFKRMFGSHPRMLEVFDRIRKTAGSNVNVLIRGESGTGKELVAHAIHSLSRQAGKPMVCVNCAALSETLQESDLFGHERGAFTDAKTRRLGFFETADGGTIFLDEIGDIPVSTQVKLLRVIEKGEFHRLGSSEIIRVNVRIIAATNRDLEMRIQDGRFREDLYYRLNTYSITLPPLRERKEDIPPLANHFLQTIRTNECLSPALFAEETMEMLVHYRWPGNVRELENEIMRVVIQMDGERIITPVLLSSKISSLITLAQRSFEKTSSLKETMQEVEKSVIREALRKNYGNKTWSARSLGITREWLHKKMSRYNIKA